jgi:hypothetical protein
MGLAAAAFGLAPMIVLFGIGFAAFAWWECNNLPRLAR